MKSLKKLSVVLSFISFAVSVNLNDWSKPCHSGSCFYDLPGHDGHTGSIKITGSRYAIADITEAAGWTILGCDPNKLVQDVRLVCVQPTKCTHLFSNRGPVNKIVRLPESCGKNAFARVAKHWIPLDQHIPSAVAKHIPHWPMRTVPKVQTLTLDVDFTAIPSHETGEVAIELYATNAQGSYGLQSRRDHSGVPVLLSALFPPWKRESPNWWDGLGFDEEFNKTLTPLDIDKKLTLLSETFSCSGSPGSVSGSINADAEVKAHAEISLGVVAKGTIIPPKFTTFGAYAGLDKASAEGTLHLTGNVTASADTGELDLVDSIIPSFGFAGILTIDPSFKIVGHAYAMLDNNADFRLDLSYSIEGAKFFFPSGPSTLGNLTRGQHPLHISIAPGSPSNSQVNASFTPQLGLGIEALGLASAKVLFNLSSKAGVALALTNSTMEHPVNGCVNGELDLDAHAATDGSLFGLVDPNLDITLFHKHFSLLNKCFGSAVHTTRDLVTPVAVAGAVHQADNREVSCHSAGPLTSLV